MTLAKLRDNRALLLGCEAIGWLHMAGKAHPDFLRHHGGQKNDYKFKDWFTALKPDWNARMAWLMNSSEALTWPASLSLLLTAFDKVLTKEERKNDPAKYDNVVGLLQAAHAMASGIEKNHPKKPSEYLGQDVTHMWRTSPFGHPERNLLVEPPAILQPGGPDALMTEIERLLDELSTNSRVADVDPWARWHAKAIGPQSPLRRAFLETLAETRIPNNDVTLWDQSYVAAALFKSAVAGALLAQTKHWCGLKYNTQWRVLVVGMGTGYYESRAVRIGDWAGARAEIDGFFDDVCRLIEVDAPLGACVYRDSEVMAFTFPGQHPDATPSDAKGSLVDADAGSLKNELLDEIDQLARARDFETPPLVTLSDSTRSFISMAKQLDNARKDLATLLHRAWSAPARADEDSRHVCPVCFVRSSAKANDKQAPCSTCRERRRGRLNAWLENKAGGDTIWVSELADQNDRVALLSFSLGLDGWLDGNAVDSLRAQSIHEWRRQNPTLGNTQNPVDIQAPHTSLKTAVSSKLTQFNKQDVLMKNLQDGFQHEKDWKTFFQKVVVDRSDAPGFDDEGVTDSERASWLVHQLFRKNASPGRVHRFWRASEAFFERLLVSIRERASRHENRWRVRRLIVKADGGTWNDRETYHGVWQDAPLGLLYRKATNDFVTITNLARCFRPTEGYKALEPIPISVTGDDSKVQRTLTISKVEEVFGHLGVYQPVIPLELSPQRFRVLVPLDAVDDILALVKARWREEFGRVWDRLPLYAGVVAFPRMTPFQAVIEATRNLEDELTREPVETWRVAQISQRDGVSATHWIRTDGELELTTTPTRLADGRDDVYYPYLAVEDRKVRFPRDFQHPRGQVYRHIADLRPGDGARIRPSRFATVFLDSTARRFEEGDVNYLSALEQHTAVWRLIEDQAPSMSALRDALGAIEDARERWLQEGMTTDTARAAWLGFVRAVLHDKLEVRGAVLDALVDAARTGALGRATRWKLQALKISLGGDR